MRKTKTMDGNTAAAYVSYAFTEVSAIFPITPSSPMAEHMDEWVAQGRKNIFGKPVNIVEMQSEAGAAGAVHGSLQAGALTTTFTASQGLLLMVPNMYKMVGERLPAVIHVAARAIATSSLSIFGDHQDVMAARQTGFAMLSEGSVQEVMDLAPVAHLTAIKARMPFLNFFDGFRISHEIQKIEVLEYEELAKLVDYDAINDFRKNSLNPDHPVVRGTSQNPDTYFQLSESLNKYYDDIPEVVEGYMAKITELTGREYHCFDYYGDPEADRILVAMGSVMEVAEEAIDYLRKNGEKVGLVKVRLYRPFSIERLLKVIPETVKKIAVLDRTKEPGSIGEPLYLDVVRAVSEMDTPPKVYGGRFGLGSKDPYPSHIAAIFENLSQEKPKNRFTIGIEDDVTNLSISPKEEIDVAPEGTTACKFWGLGSDGTVSANKSAIKIIGDHTNMYAQGYFAYDSKKSGGITVSHLRFGKTPIRSHYEIDQADFVACHNQSYVYNYNLLKGLRKNGTFVLNTIWTEEELNEKLPASMKRYIVENNIDFYIINAIKIAQQIGLGGRINMIMQSAFFKLANIIPLEDAVKYLKQAVVTSYGKKGEKVVNMNYEAIDKGIESLVKINPPEEWKNAEDDKLEEKMDVPKFVEEICIPINKLEGNHLPVSKFIEYGAEDGTFMAGTTAFEKRGIAVNVPEWIPENCIQCNQCSFVCPHAVIRPFLATPQEIKNAPSSYKSLKANGIKGDKEYLYTIGITPLDCTGCGNCAQICPAPGKALVMKPMDTQSDQIEAWNYAVEEVTQKINPMSKTTVKGSQFEQPLLEFSGACAGCGETAYAKLVTQLFGDRMMIANATGCSSIWAASGAATAYRPNYNGHGPAWANSLFEDNAEYGLGMYLGVKTIRERVADNIRIALEGDMPENTKAVLKDWLDHKDSGEGTRQRAENLTRVLEEDNSEIAKEILKDKEFFVHRSQWIFGGDGWAYDIGYGGLDHVLASGENVNVLVFDTEIYSNTGGQSSKSTPEAAVAKFAATGKRTKKKDLGLMAMTYGYVYVAQVCMGANLNQTLKAIAEAEAYNGPSLIIAYSTCISHGIKMGMSNTPYEEKRAVESGYWHLYRYNPDLKVAGKNAFSLDSKEPNSNLKEFLMGEVRYASLAKAFPEIAEELFAKTEEDAKERYERYKKLSQDSLL
ncbi:pyruvate:ferredoxin (flavodoxin) oxidoreductase [Clostridium tertium]|jgi:pyruvate-ferredoxin/flavodoxin oxidoreductase|uniref:pyruvate:ferredoxin (flavodoxin) oxidoreductase n=1 Tax=Clostridium TaxID=1485 RepID=UPI00189E7D4B|nr:MULTISPECIES: pyruvate:ferredoxin (flavodoxin) oxidoreductase [Clostridium]MDB1946332.1 pyruvate:ferredoxin (flavodoxin) oxidoreductase [Clostridium tertium]MDB1955150.1 pyruvate:ferredoxin (flavodoxin) oxidoreductase [Clostridium tertium]MDB1957825.1 pyruvate:ferredoxin (flavodoxin) oxidoreductase [Clostridium tertium]MDB1960993.1 pyruvate:ferredoxin (flavodoxin) oxidoreductase [Clostridium tertium]MDB1965908.1 pyruvate:ferredoxin (flavodoxin) oxidoreductase [Clostridium tertium]